MFCFQETVEAVYNRLNDAEKWTLSAREFSLEPVLTESDDYPDDTAAAPPLTYVKKRSSGRLSSGENSEPQEPSTNRPKSTNRLSKMYSGSNKNLMARQSVARNGIAAVDSPTADDSIFAAFKSKKVEPALHAYAIKCPSELLMHTFRRFLSS